MSEIKVFQAYRSDKPFDDKEWLPFTGETAEKCRQAAAAGRLSSYDNVFIAQVPHELNGLQPVPATALFVGKF